MLLLLSNLQTPYPARRRRPARPDRRQGRLRERPPLAGPVRPLPDDPDVIRVTIIIIIIIIIDATTLTRY